MGLGGGGQQVRGDGVVNFDRGLDHGVGGARDGVGVVSFGQEPGHDGVEDAGERHVAERREEEQVEVADVALGDEGAASAGRAHGGDELDVDELPVHGLRTVVPARVVHPLAQDLDRRLGAVLFLRGHVQVVDHDDALLADGRPDHALAPLVELRVDDVLGLVR